MTALITMTPPKMPSWMCPKSRTMTLAPTMIALNSVNTFSRTMAARERDVCSRTLFTWPRETRCATCAAVSPAVVVTALLTRCSFLGGAGDEGGDDRHGQDGDDDAQG